MPVGEPKDAEIRCQFCDFLIGYGNAGTKITCIYCNSEQEFFRRIFAGEENLYVYETIRDDNSSWRRGLMHSRKQSIRWAYEDIMSKKDDQDE